MNKTLFTAAKNPNNHRERILRDDAQKILLLNETIIVKGEVRHFGILDIGLGVYEVGLLPKGSHATIVVKDYITTLKDDGTRAFNS